MIRFTDHCLASFTQYTFPLNQASLLNHADNPWPKDYMTCTMGGHLRTVVFGLGAKWLKTKQLHKRLAFVIALLFSSMITHLVQAFLAL